MTATSVMVSHRGNRPHRNQSGSLSVFTPGQPYKGSMSTTGENDELLPERPTRQCISCFNEYDRTQTQLFKPLGVFQNYCLCEECLHKDMHGWGWHQ